MRIVFVTFEYVTEEASYDGGLANYLHRASISLSGLGHEPIIVVASKRNETFVEEGIEVHRVDTADNRIRSVIDVYTFRRYTTFLELASVGMKLRKGVRRVHVRKRVSIAQYSHLGGPAFFRLREIPTVIRLSSYTPLARERGGYDGMRACEIRQQEKFERSALGKADRIFGPSRMISALVEKEIGRPVEVIESPFVMDTGRVDDTLYRDVLRDKTYLLYFGTLNVLKGVPTIAEVIHDVLDRHPRLCFVFAGKEREGYRGMSMMDYVRQGAGEHRDRVVYLGKLRHDRLYPILANAHAVVLPSRIDNFPNTCLEAMAHRRVIVGTLGTSFEQLLEDGRSGFLCRPDEPASLLEAIGKAMSLSEEKRREMGEHAWKRVDGLRPAIAARQLVDFYDRTISAAGGGTTHKRATPAGWKPAS